MKKFVLKPSTVGLIAAVCAAFSSFMLGLLSLFFMIKEGELWHIMFVIVGFVGSAVMWANRK